MGRTAQLADEFDKRNVKPLGLSTDTASEHAKWIEDVNDPQNTNLVFPIVADADLQIAKLYDMIHPDQSETAAVRITEDHTSERHSLIRISDHTFYFKTT